MDLEKTSIT